MPSGNAQAHIILCNIIPRGVSIFLFFCIPLQIPILYVKYICIGTVYIMRFSFSVFFLFAFCPISRYLNSSQYIIFRTPNGCINLICFIFFLLRHTRIHKIISFEQFGEYIDKSAFVQTHNSSV